MKILLSYTRGLGRGLERRRLRLRRRAKPDAARPPADLKAESATASHQRRLLDKPPAAALDAPALRRLMEKAPHGQPAPHAAPLLPLPPAYHECVEFYPPPPAEKAGEVPGATHGGAGRVAVPTSRDQSRGRPREILYKLQLNELRQRRLVRRPLPPKRRPGKVGRDSTDYGAILQLQAASCAWRTRFSAIQAVMAMVLVAVCVLEWFWHI